MGRLLARKGFANLFAAGIASIAGFSVAGVCLVWIVFVTTHSPWNVALFGLSGTLSGVSFSLVGGALVDRYDRRRLMILADVVRSITIAALVALVLVAGFQLVALLAANVVLAAFSTLFNPAEQTYLPTIVREEELASANGLISSSRSAAGFLGSALAGGLIVTVGPVVGLGLDAVTLAVSAGLILLLPTARPKAPRRPSGPGAALAAFAREIREGVRWLVGNPGWLQLTVSAGFFNFYSTLYFTFLVFYSTGPLHGNALVFGGLLAGFVAGEAAGSLLVGPLGAVRYAGKAWVVPYGALSGIMLLVLALVPNLAIALTMAALLGLSSGFAGTTWLTTAQLAVPRELQGRYFGVDNLGSWAILPLAQVVGGVLVGLAGIGETYLIAGAAWTVAGLVFLIPRSLRGLRYGPSTSPST